MVINTPGIVRTNIRGKGQESLRDIYNRSNREYMAEAKIWNEIQEATASRTKPFNADNNFQNAFTENPRPLNTTASIKGESSHAGSYASIISSDFNIIASGIVGYTVPLPEFGVKYKIAGQRPEKSPLPGEVKSAIEDLGRTVTDLYLSTKSRLHNNLFAACLDLLRYGHCVLYDRFLKDGTYVLQTMDLRDFIFDTDPLTNDIYIIFRKRVKSWASRDFEYDVWLQRSDTIMPGNDIVQFPYARLVLDNMFNPIFYEPMPIMPIRMCRLFTIPGHKFAYGYGQELINEADALKKYTHLKTISAMRALTPPLECADSEALKDDRDKSLVEQLQNCEVIARNPNLPLGQPLIAPIITQNYQEITVADAYAQAVAARIQEFMLLTQYLLPEQPNMTAREISVRADQKLQLLTPMMSTIANECVEPSIENIKSHLLLTRRPLAETLIAYQQQINPTAVPGMLPDLKLEHRTKFDHLKGLAEYSYGTDAIAAVAEGMQLDPSVRHHIDIAGITRARVANSGIAQDLIYSPDVVQASLKAEQKALAEQQAQQERMAALQLMAKGQPQQ